MPTAFGDKWKRDAENVLRLRRKTSTLPLESAFLPDVNVAGENRCDEGQHFKESEEFKVVVDNGPGKEKHRFDIEEEEEHRNQIKLYRKAVTGGSNGFHTAFVGNQFGRRRLSHSEHEGSNNRYRRKPADEDQKD